MQKALNWFWALRRRRQIGLVLATAAVLTGLVPAALNPAGASLNVGGPALLLVLGLFLFFLGRFHLLVWRVRNRVLFLYFLVGVVPLALIALLLNLGARMLLGQYAADVVRDGIERRTDLVQSSARVLSTAAGNSNGSIDALASRLEEERQRLPNLRAMVRLGDRTVSIPADGELAGDPRWIDAGASGVLESNGRFFLGATAQSAPRTFAYLPIDDQARDLIASRISLTIVPTQKLESGKDDADVRIDLGRGQVFIKENGVERLLSQSGANPLPPPRRLWDPTIPWLLPWTMQGSTGEAISALIVVTTRASVLIDRLFSSLGPAATPIAFVAAFIAGALLLVEVVALAWCVRLTRTMTRSVADLYIATREVASGNLAHRAPTTARDQLGELTGSFNGMTGRLNELIGEVKKKEKLESELAIARRVQVELFPKVVPKLRTLELAGLCVPSRFVSGDYYDFVSLDDRWTAVALGDISGKGIAAALVMATVQSALHAQLKFGTVALAAPAATAGDLQLPGAAGAPSTATLMARLSEQIYENTPSEKYATFFCSVYDDLTGRLVYTNAGHLPPILVRNGQATTLDAGGMVIGLMPVFAYDEQVVELQKGDLLALFSDGITEAENAQSDQFEATRLTDVLLTHAHEPLDDIIAHVNDRVRQWAHDPESQDDMTIVLARRT